jgi:hypothetical protein
MANACCTPTWEGCHTSNQAAHWICVITSAYCCASLPQAPNNSGGRRLSQLGNLNTILALLTTRTDSARVRRCRRNPGTGLTSCRRSSTSTDLLPLLLLGGYGNGSAAGAGGTGGSEGGFGGLGLGSGGAGGCSNDTAGGSSLCGFGGPGSYSNLGGYRRYGLFGGYGTLGAYLAAFAGRQADNGALQGLQASGAINSSDGSSKATINSTGMRMHVRLSTWLVPATSLVQCNSESSMMSARQSTLCVFIVG